MKVLPRDSRVSEPWKNGAGRTATVARGADWRVSIAEVADASPFSSFPNASRALMPVSSTGLVLSVNGQTRQLGAGEIAAFDGEDTVFACELRTPVEVINLIWQRGRCHGELTAVCVEAPLTLEADRGVLIAVVTAGHVSVTGGPGLSACDALGLDRGEAVILSPGARLAVARISSASVVGG